MTCLKTADGSPDSHIAAPPMQKTATFVSDVRSAGATARGSQRMPTLLPQRPSRALCQYVRSGDAITHQLSPRCRSPAPSYAQLPPASA